jgi:peroxiredoxin
MTRALIFLCTCTLGLAGVGCGPKTEPPPRSGAPTPLAAFSLPDLQGQTYSSASFGGKITILHFCASWSPSSAREIELLRRIQDTFAEEDVQVVGIALEEDGGSDMRAFAQKTSFNYPLLIADENFHRKLGGIDAIPSTLMVDPQGQIVNRYTGLVGEDTLIADLRRMIEERKQAAKLAGK